jgi:outer membrane murein-binding lipoprotein Lpp
VSRAFAVVLFALVLAGCNGGTVDRHALKRDAEKIGSLATEGELLANDVSRGASTKYFARVHAKELSRAASNFADALAERPTSPGIETKVRRLSRLAGKVSDELEQLHLHPTDRGVAAALKQPLLDDADAADRLSK